MELVEESHGEQQPAGAEARLWPPQILDGGEFHFRSDAVLVLDLRVEEPLVVELVAEIDNGAQQVDFGGSRGSEVLVDHFAVATDRQAALRVVDLGSRRPEAVLSGRGLRRLADP